MNVAARLLADQNVPGAVVVALRQQGHNIAWILEDAPGSPDPEVLERAQQDGRVLVTFDEDFGELGSAAAWPRQLESCSSASRSPRQSTPFELPWPPSRPERSGPVNSL